MRFNPSPYSEGYSAHQDYGYPSYGAYDEYGAVPGIDKNKLLNDLNKADKGISQALPALKKARSFVRKVKPKKGFGKTWRPRWKIWNAINQYVMPKLNSAIKDMTDTKKQLGETKKQIESLPI